MLGVVDLNTIGWTFNTHPQWFTSRQLPDGPKRGTPEYFIQELRKEVGWLMFYYFVRPLSICWVLQSHLKTCHQLESLHGVLFSWEKSLFKCYNFSCVERQWRTTSRIDDWLFVEFKTVLKLWVVWLRSYCDYITIMWLVLIGSCCVTCDDQ